MFLPAHDNRNLPAALRDIERANYEAQQRTNNEKQFHARTKGELADLTRDVEAAKDRLHALEAEVLLRLFSVLLTVVRI